MVLEVTVWAGACVGDWVGSGVLLLSPPPQAASVLVKQMSMAVAKREREKEKLVYCAVATSLGMMLSCVKRCDKTRLSQNIRLFYESQAVKWKRLRLPLTDWKHHTHHFLLRR